MQGLEAVPANRIPGLLLNNSNPSGYAVFSTSLNIKCIHFRKMTEKSASITGKEGKNPEPETLFLINLSHLLLPSNKGYIYVLDYRALFS